MTEYFPRNIEGMQQLAHSRGGWCLSETYRKPLSWRCASGHEWLASAPDTIRGRWCAVCARLQRRHLRLEEAQRLARERNGQCLSPHYESIHAHMAWQCAQGHRWQASLANIKHGSWCSTCAHVKMCGTLETMQQLAGQWGGRCLSEVYVNYQNALIWECAKGHRWEAVPRTITRGHWCRACAQNSQRNTLEQMQGIAQERGGECLSSRYVNTDTRLTWRCAQGHTWEAVPSSIIRGSWCDQCVRNSKRSGIEALQSLAQERGGECLSSDYTGIYTLITLRCAQGHTWETQATNILRGSWCHQCVVDNRRDSIDVMHAIALARGGRCLSEHYVNSLTKLQWLCSMGHTWQAVPNSIKRGSWCGQCAYLAQSRKAKTRRKYLPAG